MCLSQQLEKTTTTIKKNETFKRKWSLPIISVFGGPKAPRWTIIMLQNQTFFYISFEPIKVVVASFRRIWLEDKKEHWFFLFFVRNKENCHGVRWYLHFFTLCCSYPRRTHVDTLVTNTLNVLKWVWILHSTLFFHHRERNEWHRLFWVLIKNNKT